MDQHWTARAACRATGPDTLFVEGAAQRRARELCMGCTVRLDCLVDALDSRVPYGVWGGMTERERRALLRSRPDVVSWREELLASADDDALVPAARGHVRAAASVAMSAAVAAVASGSSTPGGFGAPSGPSGRGAHEPGRQHRR